MKIIRWKWFEMAGNGWKWLEMARMARKGLKWPDMAGNGRKWLECKFDICYA